jgi:hypothetical protein
MGTDKKLFFRDSAIHISSTADGDMSIAADDEIDITSTLIDVNGNLDVSGTALVTGVLTTTASAVFNGGFTSNGDTVTFTSANNADPLLILKNTTNDASGSRIQFIKDKGAAGADGDDISNLEFIADNDAQQLTTFAQIKTEISDASDGAEGGKMSLRIATHDGELQTGLLLQDGNAEDEIDVTIGKGTSSVTTIAGNMTTVGDITFGDGHFLGDGGGDDNLHLTSSSGENIILTSAGGIISFNDSSSEHSRFDTSGNFLVGKTATGIATVGAELKATGELLATVSNDACAFLNRKSSDGSIIGFHKDGS